MYILIHFCIKILLVSKPTLAIYGFMGHVYLGENFEKITQYVEFGCIF